MTTTTPTTSRSTTTTTQAVTSTPHAHALTAALVTTAMADKGTPIYDKTLVEYAGGLMQWHVHTNLCWLTINGAMRVVGVTDTNGCRLGFVETDGSPMVHVWITPHKCGPFAALEGVAAGVADASDAERVDLCNKTH